MMRRIRGEMARRTMPGLTLPQFRILRYLRDHPRAALNEIAEHLGLTAPTVSKLVQKLVTQNVVSRRTGTDRRRVSLSLTQLGTTALAKARLETRRQLADSLRSLPAKDLTTLSAGLRMLRRSFVEGGANVNVR
jgi:MarR family transcriptional regulator for hemolysin